MTLPQRVDYLTAEEATQALDVSRATLYAYVSRGLIQSVETEGDKRKRLYSAADVRRLYARRASRKEPETVAARALDWGAPVVDSAITQITAGALNYRGHLATELAQTKTIAEAAALIWTGKFDPSELDFTPEPLGERGWSRATTLSPVEQFQSLLPALASGDPSAYDLRRATVLRTGARLLATFFGVSGFGAALLPAPPNLLTTAMVLCADHELNISTFTARCVASAGSTLYAVVNAALCALQGMRHGGETLRVAALLREVETVGVARALSERLARGDAIPGFGHRLYPLGDPRGKMLLELTTRQDAAERVGVLPELVAYVREVMGEQPTVDMGLVAVERAAALPPGSALTLFALGRTIGWIGHALEEYERGQLIRPRARYVGGRAPGEP